jgi:hypothetical protein
MAAFCLGFCLVILGLWAGPIVNEAIAALLLTSSRDLTGNLTIDFAARRALDATEQVLRRDEVAASSTPASVKAATGDLVPPLPDFKKITLPSRSFDTRDWLFIASWQASRGEHGGMRVAAVAPSTNQGKKQHDNSGTRAGRPRS